MFLFSLSLFPSSTKPQISFQSVPDADTIGFLATQLYFDSNLFNERSHVFTYLHLQGYEYVIDPAQFLPEINDFQDKRGRLDDR